MTEVRPTGTVGDLLMSRRRTRFVGRASEVELFRVALDTPEPPFLLLHLHGPPGIGKTSLLDVYAGLAAEVGATVVRLDGRDLVPSTAAVLQVFDEGLELPAEDEPGAGPPGDGRLVVLFDTYERLAPLDDWIRTRLLPRLPENVITVIAGREPPGPAWRADPAWRELLRVVSLRNLSPEDSRQYLHGCGVEPARHDQLVELAHGHPLGLSLLADVVVRGGEAAADPLTPDLVGTLLQRFVEVVPSGLHRRVLEVCAIARVTTEGVLREVLGVEDAHDPFAWLRGLSFVESGPDGVFPHDLVRDALDADLRWRDPDSYRRVFRAVRGHINARLRTSQDEEQQRAIADAKYMFRRLPGVVSPLDWDVWGQQYPEPASPGDRDAILDLVLVGEGDASAAIATRWWEQQPEGFFVVRSPDGTIGGFLALLDLTRASPEDIASDPGASAAWDHARQQAPPRPTENVTLSRFVVDRVAYQGPSATFNAMPILTMQRYLATPSLAWDFLALAEPEHWDEYFAAADLPRVAGADFWVGGRRYGLFAHDFRQVPVDALLELVTERALGQDATTSAATMRSPLLVLSQTEFDDSVRQALRDLRRPSLLARNPLLRTRLLRDAAGDEEPDAATLETLVAAAIESLREHPRTTSGGERSSAPICVLPVPRSAPPRRWDCRSARTAGISPRGSTRSSRGCGTERCTASSTEHDRTARGLVTEQRHGAPSLHRGGDGDEHTDRRSRRGDRRQHRRAARRPSAQRQLRPGDGDRPGRVARDADTSTRRPPRPPPPRARRPWAASTGGAPPRTHRRTGRGRVPGRGPARRHTLLPQRSTAATGAQRTDAPVRQPAPPGAPHPNEDANPPQPPVRRPLRRRRPAHLPRWSPRHRRASAPSRRRQRRRTAGRRPRRGRERPQLAHPAWLEVLGYPPPQQEQVRIGLGYATRTYRLRGAALDGNVATLVAATPQHPRTGAMQRLEDDRWMVTLAGIVGDHPPTDADGFVEFARSLPFPDIWESIREAEPLDDAVAFRFPASVRRRYERLRRFPAGLLVMGDALCSFNPIYGQGMSVAALEALALRRHLGSGVEPTPRHWHRHLAGIVDVPWQMAAGGDLMFPGVQGRRTRKMRLLGAYLTRLHAAAAHDADVATAFIRVAGLVSPPQSLLRPGIAMRVLVGR